ncbi:hypothetical protein ES703_107118 [subsurface metagenome]
MVECDVPGGEAVIPLVFCSGSGRKVSVGDVELDLLVTYTKIDGITCPDRKGIGDVNGVAVTAGVAIVDIRCPKVGFIIQGAVI